MTRKLSARSRTPAATRPVQVQKKRALNAAFDQALQAGLEYHSRRVPTGQQFVRVTLSRTANDGSQYTALIPVGALTSRARAADPNTVQSFFLERPDGAGGILIAGPFSMGSRGKVVIEPFFSRFLENQNARREAANP